MFEDVAGWTIDDTALFFRFFLAATVLIFSALCVMQISKAYRDGGFDSEADAMVMFGRVMIFLLVILGAVVNSY